MVNGVAVGTAHITATCQGKSGSSTITVAIVPVASVAVSPVSASVAVGSATPLTATPKDASGNTLSGRTITWASDNTAAATVSSSGVVTGVAAGTAHVTATCEGQSGSSTITVTLVPVASVTLSPTSASINVGATQQLSATPKDGSGNTLTGRIVTWASDNTAAATVSSSGLVRGVAAGTAHVTATCEGQSASSTITVTLVPVASVSVSPTSASINVGATQQLSATPKDGSGNTLTGRTITWASDNAAAATVSSSGLVRGVAAGTAHVTATCEGQSASSTITVILVPVASVTVSPASASLSIGATQQLTATPKDGSGNTLSGRTITWASGNIAVSSVSSGGMVRGVAAGTANVTATCEGQQGVSAVTVSAPVTGGGSFSNCPIFPPDNIWNRDISALPVHPMSSTWVSTLNSNQSLWVGFYPNTYGMKYVVTNGSTPKVPISITGQDPSDSDVPGPYPFSASTPIEVGNPDAHAFMIDTTTCTLYEMYLADWNSGNPQAHAAVIWNLNSNALRADGHSSADEAGLALFPGLARWDEVQAGAIRHALRFEATEGHINGTQGAHLWPARHDSQTPNSNAPPMGARFRLKASYDISKFSPHTQVVLTALKHYGMFLSDVGLDWELVGTADPNWDTNMIQELFTVPASAFEAVDESGLMIDPNSAQSR
jgi:uncharacterized protein YjdB